MNLPKSDEQTCTICLESLDSLTAEQMTLECNHSYHKNCINTWMEKESSCPLCRTVIGLSNLTEQQNMLHQIVIYRCLGRIRTMQIIIGSDMIYATISINSVSILAWFLTLLGHFGASTLSIHALIYYLIFKLVSSFYLGCNLIGYINEDKLNFSKFTKNDFIFSIDCFVLMFYCYIVYIVFFVIKDITKFRTELVRILF